MVITPQPPDICSNTTAALGDNVTFFCKYSIGTKSSLGLDTRWAKNTSDGMASIGFVPFQNPNDTAVYEEITYYEPDDGENISG